MTTFICTTTDCPNKDVAYNFDGEVTIVECGGCRVTLTPIVSS